MRSALVSFGALLAQFSPWAVAVLLLAGLPAFIAETKVLGRRVPAVSLARAGDAHADLPRDRDRARGPRQGGEALRARADAARPLPRDLQEALSPRTARSRSGARPGASSLGLVGTAALYGAYAWIAVAAVRRPDHARRDDDVPAALPAGPGGRVGGLAAIGGMYEDNLYLSTFTSTWTLRWLEPPGRATQRPGPGRRRALRGRELHATRAPTEPAARRRHASHLRPGRASRWSARTAPAKPRSSSCSRACTSRRPAASCSTGSTSRTGTRPRCVGGSA